MQEVYYNLDAIVIFSIRSENIPLLGNRRVLPCPTTMTHEIIDIN